MEGVIYLVGDQRTDLEDYADVLTRHGYETKTFSSPAEALRAIAADSPCVVLAELLMLEMDGFDLLYALRTEPATRDQRLVIASAVLTKDEFASVVENVGGWVFLPKPATPNEVLAAVEEALDPGLPAGGDPPADFDERHLRAMHSKLLEKQLQSEATERELVVRAHRDAALAELGRRALAGVAELDLQDEACVAVSTLLEVELVEVLQLEDDDHTLRMTAGLGWPDGVVSSTVDDAHPDALGVCMLMTSEVRELEDCRARDDLPERLSGAAVVRGLRVAVLGAGRPLGILGAYSTRPQHSFVPADRTFLQAVANLIGVDLANRAALTALERRERELSALFDDSREALIVTDLDLRSVRVNDAACRLFGRSREEMIGLPSSVVIAPESVADLAGGWNVAPETGESSGELAILRPDGSRRRVEYSGTKEIVPGLHLIALRDVTERSVMEEALRRTTAKATAAHRRYLDLIETLPDGVVAVDTQGRIALVNAQMEQMFGYSRAELIGQTLEFLLPERLRDAHVVHRTQQPTPARSSAMARGLELCGCRKDGSEFPIEIGLSAVETDSGQLVTAVVTDTTERTHLERQLLQAQKLEAVGRLAGGVAHDFNNLLQVITGYVESLQARASHGIDADELAEIADAANRAAALTRQLLAFSRQQTVQPTTFDLNLVVGDMERMLGRLIGEDVDVSIRLAPDLPAITADRAQIEQVIANLVVNARDAMPSGGILSIATRCVDLNGDAAALALQPGRYVQLRVTDTGLGMDDATLTLAFEPFFTTKDEGHGTGLGLSMVHGIVAQSGGNATIESVVGAGTTVSVHLPAAGVVGDPPQPAQVDPVAGGHERVLLVEDEPVVRRLLESVLVRLGYDVSSAEDGDVALGALAAAHEPFDLVVSDYVMPHTGGAELVSRFRELGIDPCVLFVSGYAPGVDVAGVGDDGRKGFLQKPFTNDEFATRVRELLDAPSEPA